MTMISAADLPAKKSQNLAAIKTMVAAAESEAQKRNVQVTICIVDESGKLLFLAFYKEPSNAAAGKLKTLLPIRAGCPFKSTVRRSEASV
jgi:hypothetical protein